MTTPERPEIPKAVRRVFDAYPEDVRDQLLIVRNLIYSMASSCDDVGPLTETLKWGEPAYLTEQTKSGTTIRLGFKKSKPDHACLYVHCQTNLVEVFRQQFSGQLEFEGNRAILFRVSEPLPVAALETCIVMALRYHLAKTN